MITKSLRCLLPAIALAAGLLTGCAGTPGQPAAGTSLQASAEVRQALAPSGKLRVAVYVGSPTSYVPAAAGGGSAGNT